VEIQKAELAFKKIEGKNNLYFEERGVISEDIMACPVTCASFMALALFSCKFFIL
jgi:hypothetical protein